MQKTNDVIGLGNVLMDFLVEVDESVLEELNLPKGQMSLVDEDKATEVFNKAKQFKIENALGGSAANTLRGIGFLGGKAIFCGKIGDDEHGQSFITGMNNHNVTTNITTHPKVTGHVVSFITPDTERTMSTHLGAAIHLAKEDLSEEQIKNSKVIYLEAYQFEGPTKETLLHAMNIAKQHGTLIAIDLADPGLISRNLEFFKQLVKDHVDIIFVNEKEAKEFTGLENEEEAVKEIGKDVKVAIVKIGEKGSLVHYNNSVTKINPFKANAIDTTGAGDTFAAGFLYGYCNGWSIQKSGRLGSLAASKIVEKKGVKIKELNLEEIKKPFGL